MDGSSYDVCQERTLPFGVGFGVFAGEVPAATAAVVVPLAAEPAGRVAAAALPTAAVAAGAGVCPPVPPATTGVCPPVPPASGVVAGFVGAIVAAPPPPHAARSAAAAEPAASFRMPRRVSRCATGFLLSYRDALFGTRNDPQRTQDSKFLPDGSKRNISVIA